MKRLLHIAIGLIFSLQMQAQTFPLQGSEWWHSYYGVTPPLLEDRGYIHTWVDGDSIINGTKYQRLRQEIQYKSYTYTFLSDSLIYIPSDTILHSLQPLPSIFVSTANDSVYFLDKLNKKQFVWYNNPQPGDIWHLGKGPKYQYNIQDSVNAYVKITSVYLEPLNGFSSKTITFSFCDSLGNDGTPSSLNYLARYAYTKTNTVYGFSDLILYATGRDYFRTYVGDEANLFDNRLVCFQSPQTSHIQFLPEFQDCLGLITHSMNETNITSALSVYPNPVNAELWIKNEQNSNYTARLLDMNGRVLKGNIKLESNSTQKISTDFLNKGMYILIVIDNEGNTQAHKFIKN